MLRCFGSRSHWAAKCSAKNNLNLQNGRFLSAQPALKEKTKDSYAGKFNIGKLYNGFLCTEITHVKEFNMTAILLKHERSKTEYLHLQRDDPNNVFSINFRTTPFNSTGLPHILEHTVLCGSKKFPVRDPFFKMLNRSLATFMNAMTGPDYTFYPFSSQNEADYRNLQSIYLDAVFQPHLNHQDFLQEGWRLEHSDLNDANSPLTFKGVVFNEMKGAFAENSSIFSQKFLNTILPDHTYGYVSGGDPLLIPNLTITELKEFHKRYYSPSNARIYSYGNFPLERNLEICDQLYLGNYEGIDSSYSRVPAQPRWNKPIDKQMTSRFDKMGAPLEKQNQMAVGYLMCDITDVYETFVLNFLSQLMVMGPNSPFYKSLIEPNISGGYSSVTGYDPHMKDTMFLIGLQDLEVHKFDMVKNIIDETLDKIIQEGFDKNHINSVLHGIELSIKHQHTRFGLNTLFNLVPLWNHEGPLMEALQVSTFLEKFKDNLKNPKYLSERVEYYFKRNNHRLTLTMVPDEKYEENLDKIEADLLNKKISELNDADKKIVYEEGLKLAKTQKSHENLDILPCLSLSDIPKELGPVHFEETFIGNIPFQVCEANTNEVTYLKGVLNTADLPECLKLLIPLFNETATKMDTTKRSYREFDQLVHLKTGGLFIGSHISEKIDEPSNFEEGVIISSHCLDQNIDGMLSLWSELFDKPIYKDVDRFKMLLENYISNLTTGIADSGHMYAMHCANSLISKSGFLKEELGGLRHIEHMKNLVKNQSPEQIMLNVSAIANSLLDGNRLRAAVNLSKNNKKTIIRKLEEMSTALPKISTQKSNEKKYTKSAPMPGSVRCLHHVLNIPVNFCAKSIVAVPFTHQDFAKLRVLAKFLSSKYLHPVVREQNGAYGGGAKLGNDGIFNFFSYRDPNSRVTLDVFDNTVNWFKDNSASILTDQSLFEAKLGVLQALDAPVAEFYKGIDDFLHSISRELVEKHRSQILSVTKEDLAEVCELYLSDRGQAIGKCVIGTGKNSTNDAPLMKDGENWDVVKPVSDEV